MDEKAREYKKPKDGYATVKVPYALAKLAYDQINDDKEYRSLTEYMLYLLRRDLDR